MTTDFFLCEIILESLADTTCIDSIQGYLIKTRAAEMPKERFPLWHIHRYRLPREQVLRVTPLIEKSLGSGEWYVHLFSEKNDELFVIIKGRTFRLPKIRNNSWDEMIRYGESVGLGRRWTESIPVKLPE